MGNIQFVIVDLMEMNTFPAEMMGAGIEPSIQLSHAAVLLLCVARGLLSQLLPINTARLQLLFTSCDGTRQVFVRTDRSTN